jgi:hypothetical protein
MVHFFKLFISKQNYIRFYKVISCESVRREEAYPKISPHFLFQVSLNVIVHEAHLRKPEINAELLMRKLSGRSQTIEAKDWLSRVCN